MQAEPDPAETYRRRRGPLFGPRSRTTGFQGVPGFAFRESTWRASRHTLHAPPPAPPSKNAGNHEPQAKVMISRRYWTPAMSPLRGQRRNDTGGFGLPRAEPNAFRIHSLSHSVTISDGRFQLRGHKKPDFQAYRSQAIRMADIL